MDKRAKEIREQIGEVHHYLPTVFDRLRQGRISRREFMRTATLLGLSAGVATVAAGCGGGAAPEDGGGGAAAPAEEEAAPAAEEAMEEEAAAPAGGPKRGGTLIVGTNIAAVDHPARFPGFLMPTNFDMFLSI